MRTKVLIASIFIIALLLGAGVSRAITVNQVRQADITNIAKFVEDKIPGYNFKKSKIYSFSINDTVPKEISNIWITYNFTKDKKYASRLVGFLDYGYDIFVQGDNIEGVDVYDALNIPEEKRVTKGRGSRGESNSQLYPVGARIFKYKDLYYVTGINTTNKEDVEGLLDTFNMGKRDILIPDYPIEKRKLFE